MSRPFSYTLVDKLLFYFSYFFYKLIIPLEMRNSRLSFWFYEMRYTAAKFVRYESSEPWHGPNDLLKTRFGTFRVRLHTSDAAHLSPAFERRDQNHLMTLIQTLSQDHKKVLFLDVGGDIGVYSVVVGNRFTRDQVDIHCFEPLEASCKLIKDNLALNALSDRVVVHQVALGDSDNDHVVIRLNAKAPGSSSLVDPQCAESFEMQAVQKQLDHIFTNDFIQSFGAVIMKIDVEGMEEAVLKGAQTFLKAGIPVYAMIEDFIQPEITTYLESTGWSFSAKKTSYNSWWKYG